MPNLSALAQVLHEARAQQRTVPRWTPVTALDLDAAYGVQAELVARMTAGGDRVVGVKLGFTSRAKARQMGVDEPIAGVLTASMRLDHDTRAVARLQQPRIEPEVAFRVDFDSGQVTAVAAGLEIIDSRYTDFDFGAADVVADNASAAAFVVGPWAPATPDLLAALPGARTEIARDGVVCGTAAAAEILGDPLRAVVAAQQLRRRLTPLPAPAVLLAGATTAALPLDRGVRYEARIQGLEPARISVDW